MSELRRVVFSKRIILITVFAVLLCCMFFSLELKQSEAVSLGREELLEYAESYPAFLDSVTENAENSAILSSQGRHAAYIRKNAEKTRKDYGRLCGIKINAEENTVITAFSEFAISDFAVLIIMAAVIIMFSEEKDKGLSRLVRCTKGGRARLSIERTFCIVVSAFMASVLITVSCMITGWALSKDMHLFEPIQSVPAFKLCAMPISILEHLILSVLLGTLGASVFGLFAQLFLTKLSGSISLFITGIFAALELFLHKMIGGTDRLSGLKLANMIPMLRGSFFFKQYYNVNVFGTAVGFLAFAAVILLSLCLLMAIVSAVICEKSRAGDFGLSAITKIKRWISLHTPNPSIFLWELKKLMFHQKGLIIALAVVYMAASSVLRYGYVAEETPERDYFYKKYAGEITAEKIEAIHEEYKKRNEKIAEKTEEYFYLLDHNLDPDRRLALFQQIYDMSMMCMALEEVQAEADAAYEYTLRDSQRKTRRDTSEGNFSFQGGIAIQLVNPDTYRLLLSDDQITTDRNSMLLLLGMIGVFAGISSHEEQCRMRALQRVMKNGRGRLLLAKLAAIAITAPVMTAGVFLPQFLLIGKASVYNDCGAAAQSIELLRNVPFEISIGGYLLLMYFLRVFFTFMLGCAILFISRCCKSRITSLAACGALLALPAMLSLSGIFPVRGILNLLGYTV